MKRILAAYDAASSPAEWAECNRQFHLALCAPANNARLRKMIEEYCLSTTNRYPHLRMSLDTEKNEVQAITTRSSMPANGATWMKWWRSSSGIFSTPGAR
ncbi:FCD domain-containing protein [Paraburkholderia sp. BR10872]|uniref:FCD domain-containing protein n=1 Tax=Paraburkholderia sp. BR10872 TaxID=3236989 RepID=UPI0034D1F96C